MKTPPNTPEFARFTSAMRDIMKVSKAEVESRLDTKKRGKRVSSVSSRVLAAAPKKPS